MTSSNGFDLELVKRCFEEAKQSDGQILLQKYVEGFKEIDRFFCMMGKLFGFIAKDLIEKGRILTEHASENPDAFVTVQSMVDYEVKNNLTKTKTKSGLLSGSRTLLRLHRSLQFFAQFLGKVLDLNDEEGCGHLAAEVYADTLGHYHRWIIRQAAYLAVRSLPIKQVLVDDHIKQSKDEAEKLAPLTVKAMMDVYDIVESLYSSKGMLDLP